MGGPALANTKHFPGGGGAELLPESKRPFPEAFYSAAAALSGPRPYLLGSCQMNCPALAYRTADSSPQCRQSISSSTHGLKSRWLSWVPGDLSLEQRELQEEKRESSTEELYVQKWDGRGHFLFYCMILCGGVFCLHVCLCTVCMPGARRG